MTRYLYDEFGEFTRGPPESPPGRYPEPVLPLSKGGRGRTKNPGRMVQALPANQSATVVEVQGDDDGAVGMTVVLTRPRFHVTHEFDINTPPTAFARIEWGNGGIQEQVDVDCIRGTLVYLPGSDVRVSVHNTTRPTEADTSIDVGAFISYLPYSGESSATRTLEIDAIAAGTSVTLDIPNMSNYLRVIRTPASREFNLQILRGNTQIAEIFVPSSQEMNRVHIPNFADQVRVNNPGASDIDEALAQFTLAL